MAEPPAKRVKLSFGCTNVTSTKFSFLWEISDFNLLLQVRSHRIQSPVFTTPEYDGLSWTLSFYPEGQTQPAFRNRLKKHNRDCTSIFIQQTDRHLRKSSVAASLFIVSPTMETLYSISKHPLTNGYSSSQTTFGYKKWAKRDLLPGFLSNDTLTILCEMMVVFDVTTTAHTNVKHIQEPQCSLKNDLKQLLSSKKYGDVVLKVGNKRILVYMGIVASRAPTFAAILNAAMKKKGTTNEVRIPDVDEETMEHLLEFVYTGETTHLATNAENLLEAAHKYELSRLKALCENELVVKLSAENAGELLELADRCNAEYLHRKTVEYIRSNMEMVSKSVAFREFIQEFPNLAMKILTYE